VDVVGLLEYVVRAGKFRPIFIKKIQYVHIFYDETRVGNLLFQREEVSNDLVLTNTRIIEIK